MGNQVIITERTNKVIYREGDKVIKAFAVGYSKSDILNEAVNQARVEETGLNIPKILGVKTIDGKWSIELEFVEGKTLQQLMDENPDKINEYLDKFVELQMEVHSKRAPLLSKLDDKLERKINNAPIDASTRYELHQKLSSISKHRKVCHGDFNPSNIIVRPDGEMFILDWSHATQGNASGDAAQTYLEFLISKNEDLARKYLNLYCKKSDTAIQYVLEWVSIVAAAGLSKASDDVKELLLRFINVVEY